MGGNFDWEGIYAAYYGDYMEAMESNESRVTKPLFIDKIRIWNARETFQLPCFRRPSTDIHTVARLVIQTRVFTRIPPIS